MELMKSAACAFLVLSTAMNQSDDRDKYHVLRRRLLLCLRCLLVVVVVVVVVAVFVDETL
jgi:hypothetical protein